MSALGRPPGAIYKEPGPAANPAHHPQYPTGPVAVASKSASSQCPSPPPPAAATTTAPSVTTAPTLPVSRPAIDDVTTGFDDLDSEYGSSVEDEYTGKGKGKAVGRPSAAALARCNDLGETTRAAATAIAEEYRLQYQTVLHLSGLGLKASKPRNISNAVKKVFAHEYREEHGGDNAPDGAADAHYAEWKAAHGHDLKAVKAMFDSAHDIDLNIALEGVTATQLRHQCLNISKQLTHLGKIYLNTQGFMVLGAVIHLKDEFASSIFAGDEDLLNKLLEVYGVSKDRRGFLHKVKVKLQNRQLDVAENPEAPAIPLLCETDFIKPEPNSKRSVHDWSSSLVLAWLRQEAGDYYFCSRFVYITWQSVALKHNLVLVGTDKHMPFQPGAFWITRENRKPGQPIMGQNHFMNLVKRINSPFNKGQGRHYDLELSSLPLCILPLDQFFEQCPDVPRDPQPAVVSHDGEVLVYTTEEHYKTDAARDCCVEYQPVPFPPKKKVAKGKRTASVSRPRAATTKPPVRCGPAAPSTSNERPAATAASQSPVEASPRNSPVGQRRVAVTSPHSLHIPSPYVSAPYIPRPLSPLDVPFDFSLPTRKCRKIHHQGTPDEAEPTAGKKQKLDDIAAEDTQEGLKRPTLVGRGPPPIRVDGPATPNHRQWSRPHAELLPQGAPEHFRAPSTDRTHIRGQSRPALPPARGLSSRPQVAPPSRAESARPPAAPPARPQSVCPHAQPQSRDRSSCQPDALPHHDQSSRPQPRPTASRPQGQPRGLARPAGSLQRPLPYARDASHVYQRETSYIPSDQPQRMDNSGGDRFLPDSRYTDRAGPECMDYLQVPQHHDHRHEYHGDYYQEQSYQPIYHAEGYVDYDEVTYPPDDYEDEYADGYQDRY
ncbi:hypothetical protein HWV62_36037 [Athelia sp. TMB]|nr:hypothetical protein HWV62_36037 [Athelia sp. TMB]